MHTNMILIDKLHHYYYSEKQVCAVDSPELLITYMYNYRVFKVSTNLVIPYLVHNRLCTYVYRQVHTTQQRRGFCRRYTLPRNYMYCNILSKNQFYTKICANDIKGGKKKSTWRCAHSGRYWLAPTAFQYF